MKRLISVLLVLLLLPIAGIAENSAPEEETAEKTAGTDIALEDVTDFYYTVDASTAPPYFQRYRFYREEEKFFFYHETREGGGWPQTEEDITESGTVELRAEQWEDLCELLRGGVARVREESLEDGDAGPWLYIYWTGGEEDGREFTFESLEKESLFEEYCIGLKEGYL